MTTRFAGLNVTTHQVTRNRPVRISFPADSVYVVAMSDFDKAIFVEAEEGKKISVYVVNNERTSSDGFVALPCDGMAVTSFNMNISLYQPSRRGVHQGPVSSWW